MASSPATARDCSLASRGGVDGDGGEQQFRNVGGVPETTETKAGRAAERHLGQQSGAPSASSEVARRCGSIPGRWALNLGLVNLPGYSPDFNADDAVWGWVRDETTGNLCLGTVSRVQERVGSFLAALASRKDDVKRRCRTVLQSRAESFLRARRPDSLSPANAYSTLALA